MSPDRAARLAVFFSIVGLVAAVLSIVAFRHADAVRPATCPIIVYEDGSWAPAGWHPAEGFPPVNCKIVVAEPGVRR